MIDDVLCKLLYLLFCKKVLVILVIEQNFYVIFLSLIRFYGFSSATVVFKGLRKGGGGKKSLSLMSYKNVITCASEINCFRIHLLVNMST